MPRQSVAGNGAGFPISGCGRSLKQPQRRIGKRDLVRVVIDRDGVEPAGDVLEGGADVAAVAAYINAGADLAGAIWNGAARMPEQDVLATATGEEPPRLGNGPCSPRGLRMSGHRRGADRRRGR